MFYGYAIPPFSLMGCNLQKVLADQATVLVIAPMWLTRPWFSVALRMLIDLPRFLPKGMLKFQHRPHQAHPLQEKLTLVALMLSGNIFKQKDFQRSLPNSSLDLGEKVHSRSTGHISKDGCYFVVDRKLIHFIHL